MEHKRIKSAIRLKPKKLGESLSKEEKAEKEVSKVVVSASEKKETAKPIASRVTVGLYNLKIKRKRKKILGRGPSSGHGKTSTRGSKGQTSRSGRDYYLGFEGGQTPLIRRIPKRGFSKSVKEEYQIVNLKDLARLKGELVTPEVLEQAGLIKDKDKPVKILAEGEVKRPITIKAHAFSSKAQEKLTQSGSQFEVLNA